jgi:hypothetical protein
MTQFKVGDLVECVEEDSFGVWFGIMNHCYVVAEIGVGTSREPAMYLHGLSLPDGRPTLNSCSRFKLFDELHKED